MSWEEVGGRCPRQGPPLTTVPHPLQEFVWEASHYLVRQVFNSLQEMFSGTRAIQVCPLPLPLPGPARLSLPRAPPE